MMDLSHTLVWRKIRERKILSTHRKVAGICRQLIEKYKAESVRFDLVPKKKFSTDRIIWQYWAQGFDDVAPIVRDCLDSVDKYSDGYTVVRLTDDNLSEYLDLPDFVQKKRACYSKTHFSDLLRLMMLSGPIPEEYARCDFFVFRRDPNEPDRRYWRNTYAYYFGWAKGFRVNMLSSFIIAKQCDRTISDLCELMLFWWRDNDGLPDYFFFQILYDVYNCKEVFPLVSDTFPHYLQQSHNDPDFKLMTREQILSTIPIHKLTYK
jgi:hypothetical protein